jgi:hypothetical protein
MENSISGAIDYVVYKDNSKYIVLLLDNHSPQSYCNNLSNGNFSGIERLFEHYIKKDTLFVFEELEGVKPSDQYQELFTNTPHLQKYMEFYSKYKYEKNKIKSVDIRILFDNFHKSDGLNLLDQFFGLIPCIDQYVQPILSTILDATNKSAVFATHYKSLAERYLELKKNFISPIKCDNSSFIEDIYLTYPFEPIDLIVEPVYVDINKINSVSNNICAHIEQLLSGLLEIYTIANILQSSNKYVFVYLGAAHCVSICGLFDKYYKIRKVKELKHFKIEGNRFNLGTLDIYTKSCVNFNSELEKN